MDVGNLEHPDLVNLADRMKSTVLMSRAPGTVDGYTRAFNRWKEFASRWGEVASFPADPLPVALYRRLVSSVGRAPVCCAGGRGFEPQTGPILRVLKKLRRMYCLCNYICKWLDVQVFSDKDYKP